MQKLLVEGENGDVVDETPHVTLIPVRDNSRLHVVSSF